MMYRQIHGGKNAKNYLWSVWTYHSYRGSVNIRMGSGGKSRSSYQYQYPASSPPPFLFPRPPKVIVVPRSEIVIAPHPEVDVFFYGDYWWSPRGDRWFRSRDYNGPWNVVSLRHVPSHVRGVPKNHRTVYEKEPRYPYENHDRWMKQRNQEKRERKEYKKENKHGRGRGRNND
ncbi:MAG: hypothetical protein KKF00_08675 [Proteobacteria bacterium]|nr:hypothetical protein [Pseudomonadota bacterium]